MTLHREFIALIEVSTATPIRTTTTATTFTYGGESYAPGGNLISIEGMGAQASGAPRLRISLAIRDPSLRSGFLNSVGPVEVEVIFLTRPRPKTAYKEISKVKGHLTDGKLEGNVYSFIVAPPNFDLQRGRALYWDHDSQQQRAAGDRGFEMMASLAEGLSGKRWPLN